jgi:hypothetical protein
MGGLYRCLLGKLNGINTGQKGLSRKQPQANESIDPEVSIFNGYREYLLRRVPDSVFRTRRKPDSSLDTGGGLPAKLPVQGK